MKKKKGSIEFGVSMAVISIMSLFLLFIMKITSINIARDYVENGLVASNLASAVIDIDEYGTTNKILIKDFNKAYSTYFESLKDNLSLGEGNIPTKGYLSKEKVEVIQYTVYNVEGDTIYETTRRSNGSISKKQYNGQVGKMKTPDGAVITTTTIYSKIGFYISGYKNENVYATKENSVDISKN